MSKNKITLNFITSNLHKFLEARTLIDQYTNQQNNLEIEINHLKIKYPELQGSNLEEIAFSSLGMVLTTIDVNPKEAYFIEDAGLFIEPLNGFPGPYSSYIFSTIGWKGILKLLKNMSDNRNAYFKSVIAIYYNNKIKIFSGITFGQINNENSGTQGFGFDPIFSPNNLNKTFAEMTPKEKNQYSHRSKAIKKMLIWLEHNLF